MGISVLDRFYKGGTRGMSFGHRHYGDTQGPYRPDPDSGSNPVDISYVTNSLNQALKDENDLWEGVTVFSVVETSTWIYVKSLLKMTTAIANNIRTSYTSIYQDLPLETCNSLTSAPEVIQDSNLGFSTNKILLNYTDISLLIPPPTCVLPGSQYPGGPLYDDRKNMTAFIIFLGELNDFYECIMMINAFPSYTKGVNCLEDYYYGSQDASANPSFFDLMSMKGDFQQNIEILKGYKIYQNIDYMPLSNFTEIDQKITLLREYADVARKARALAQFMYNAITKNYSRLQRLKTCTSLEAQIYAQSTSSDDSWCKYVSCLRFDYILGLAGIRNANDTEMYGSSGSHCVNSTCNSTNTYPDPFYCDTNRTCPTSMYCSFSDRHCYKTRENVEFVTSSNSTVCGYPKRLADANTISGNVTNAFSGPFDKSVFGIKTFWPQNCTVFTSYVTLDSPYTDFGPVSFPQVCYPFIGEKDGTDFYINSTYDCDILGYTIEIFDNVEYTSFIDGVDSGNITSNFTMKRPSVSSPVSPIQHCKKTGVLPIYYDDFDARITNCLQASKTYRFPPSSDSVSCNIDDNGCQPSNKESVRCPPADDSQTCQIDSVRCQDDPSCGVSGCETCTFAYTTCRLTPRYDAKTYMTCTANAGCTTINSTHACFNRVQDILRIYNYNKKIDDLRCENLRIYGNANNVTKRYVDPNVSALPPQNQSIPPGYRAIGRSIIPRTNYTSLSGTYTVYPPGRTIPTLYLDYSGIEYLGYYSQQNDHTYRLCGRLIFYTNDGILYAEGIDMFLKTTDDVVFHDLPTLAVSNTTGVLLWNPLTDTHPNPRFEDKNECFYLQVTANVSLEKVESPSAKANDYKREWMSEVERQVNGPNQVPVLYPCAAIFLRKILYIQNGKWASDPDTDYDSGVSSGDLRYTCARSLTMSAQCSRFGSPMSSSAITAVLDHVNPPMDRLVLEI